MASDCPLHDFSECHQEFVDKDTLKYPEKWKEIMKMDNNHFPLIEVSMVLANISDFTKPMVKVDIR